jgi:hypothetical protein
MVRIARIAVLQPQLSTSAGTNPTLCALEASGVCPMHLVDKQSVQRAERVSEAVLSALIWGGLAACVIVATLFDLGVIHF